MTRLDSEERFGFVEDLVLGPWKFQCFHLLASLKVFEALRPNPGLTVGGVLHECCPDEALRPLVEAALEVALASGALVKDPAGRLMLAEGFNRFLLDDGEECVTGLMDLMARRSWQAWAAAARALVPDPEQLDPQLVYWRGMESLSAGTAPALLACGSSIERASKLLDLGGASGQITVPLAAACPQMSVILLDRAQIVAAAAQRAAAAGISDRFEIQATDSLTDGLPTDCDAALLSMILHGCGEMEGLEVLQAVHAALQPGGRIFVCELVADAGDQRGQLRAAVMNANMTIETPEGRNWTSQVMRGWLERSGFVAVEEFPLVCLGANVVLTARKSL